MAQSDVPFNVDVIDAAHGTRQIARGQICSSWSGGGGGGCHLDRTWTNRLFVVGGGKGCHLDCIWTNRLFVVKQVVSGTNRLFVGGEQGVSFRLHVDK